MSLGVSPAADQGVPDSALLYAGHTSNNPVKYIDPTGHRYCDWDPGTGECEEQLVEPDEGWDPRLPGYGGGRNSNSDVDWTTPGERLKKTIDRAIPSGFGISFSIGPELAAAPLVNAEGGLFIQVAYLWKNGSLIIIGGSERQANLGLPSAGGEISVGLVTYHNIDKPKDLLGKDYYGEVEIGGEALGTVSLSKSVSVAVDETTEKPVRNPYNSGIMYSTETALNLGLDILSTGGEFQVGGGSSQTNWFFELSH